MFHPLQLRSNLPAWNALCETYLDLDSSASIKRSIEVLKKKGPNWRFVIARFILKSFFSDPCYGKFLKCSWDDALEMTAEQLILNRELVRQESQTSLSHSLEARASNTWSRPFGQMPCTADTAQKRVEKVSRMVPRDAPILLLGDDDLVSVELATSGFTHLTAIDIDPAVLAEIDRMARKKNVHIRLCEHDLTKPPPKQLFAPYQMVLFDSEYSLEGVQLFLKAGLELSGRSSGTIFFMSLHLMSLFRQGIESLDTLLSQEGLEITECLRGFNAYPTPRKLQSLILLWNRLVVGAPHHLEGLHDVSFLHSDALVVRKK